MPAQRRWMMPFFALALTVLMAMPAVAEVDNVRIGYQRTIAILPLIVMEKEKLMEKEAQKANISLTASYTEFASGAPMNDAIISGSLDIGSAGTGPFLTLWSKSRGIVDVKGLAGSFTGTYDLVTRNPAVKSLRDFSDEDRIAVPAVGISIQAVILQMAVAKEFGIDNWKRMDRLTVALPQPDGLTALLSGGGQVTAQLAGPPFQQRALQDDKIRKILNSDDVFDGGFTGTLSYATTRFVDDNPQITEVFMRAMDEAVAFIERNPHKAAEIFVNKGKMDVGFVENVLKDPSISYSTTPKNVLALAAFMNKTGRLDELPADWRDFFHKPVHKMNGS